MVWTRAFSRRSWNLTAAIATVVLLGYVGFLIFANYFSHAELRKVTLDRLRQDTERRATAISYFFSERRNDLRDVTADRTISAFFENKALGMSMEYGLRASLLSISDRFDRLLEEKTIGVDRIYRGIVFLDKEGTFLVERNFPKAGHGGGNWLPGISNQERGAVAIEPDDALDGVRVSIPYFFKGAYVGQVVADVSLEAIYKHLVQLADGPSKRSAYLASREGTIILPKGIQRDVNFRWLENICGNSEWAIQQLEYTGSFNKSEDILVSCFPVEGTPFLLVSTFSASEYFGHMSPWQMPLAMGALTFVFFGGAVLAWRTSTRNMVLQARLEEAAKGKVGVEEKNRQLEKEIADRRRAEAALRESEERYRKFFEEDFSGAFICAADGKILACNPAFAQIFGFASLEEAMNSNITSVYPDPKRREFFLEQLRQEKKLQYYESEYRRLDGKIIHTIENVIGTFDKNGELREIKGFIIDNTAHKQLEGQLRQSQKMEAIGTLAGGIAHDFNNILTAIIGYTEMALFKMSDKDPLRRNLEQVLTAGNRAKDLVRQILAFSRQTEQVRKPLQISLIVKEALKLLRASLPSTIEIRQALNAQTAMVVADPIQIHQVLMNLCANAAHSMRERGGTLRVSLEEYSGVGNPSPSSVLAALAVPYVVLTVTDTGSGIDKSILDRIFDPFFTTKGPGEGTGMGLSVVHGIVKSHGGWITVESELGKGSTFSVFLPKAQAENAQEAEVLVHILPQCKERKRILLVDDECSLLEIGEQILMHIGYDVVAMQGGLEALDAFRSAPGRFDLVITDQTMPKMTGAELAKEILQIRPDIPIVLCTGFSEAVDQETAKAIGISEFMMKPFTFTELAGLVRGLLEDGDEMPADFRRVKMA